MKIPESLRRITVWIGDGNCAPGLCAHVAQANALGSNLMDFRHVRNTPSNIDMIPVVVANALRRDLGFDPEIEYAAGGLVPRGGRIAGNGG
jgi:hypothetical protein